MKPSKKLIESLFAEHIDDSEASQAHAETPMAIVPMLLGEYQTMADYTSTRRGEVTSDRTNIAIHGCNSEAGELANSWKHVIGHGHDLDAEEMVLELGDLLWYVAETASALGLSLDYVAYKNLKKLRKRYPDGFDAERSRNREGE